jgi:glycine cleavage system H protein
MAAHFPEELRYTKDHEWTKLESDDLVTVGITDHAQNSLGDIVYLELPQPGKQLKKGETLGVVESIKAVSDIYSPVTGTVVEAHSDLSSDPAAINSDPYGRGWLLKIRVTDKNTLEGLLDAKAYEQFVQSQS